MTRNLKLYRSLNTRPARTVGLRAQLARCMVAYRYSIRIFNKFWIQQLIYSLFNQNFLPSSATNDQGSKITTKTLEKIFQKDQKMLKLPPISTTKSNPGLNFSFELLISCSERKNSEFFSGNDRKSAAKSRSSSIFQPKSNTKLQWADWTYF